MSETRLEKYKNYRESLKEVKENNKTVEAVRFRDDNVVTDKLNTTSTLPLDEVLGQINEENEETSNKLLTRKRVQIIVVVAIGVLLIAGITIFAIFAFGR